jgi:hypothetical protein
MKERNRRKSGRASKKKVKEVFDTLKLIPFYEHAKPTIV